MTAFGQFAAQTNDFSITWDATPSQNNEDVVMGLSNGVAKTFTDLACMVRFWTTGYIEARNGASYGSSTQVAYTANTTYFFRMVVRMSDKTYDVFVKAPNATQVVLASNFAFRVEEKNITQLNYLNKLITKGDANCTNMSSPQPVGAPPTTDVPPVTTTPPPGGGGSPPVVTAASFNLTIPAASGATVGTVTATNSPTSWSITAGDPSGYFVIDNSGNMTVSAAGASGITASTYNLTVQATNSAGSGTGAVGVTASQASGTPPKFPTDAGTGVPSGTTLTKSAGFTVSSANQTYTALDITGTVTIGSGGTNATFVNCKFTITSATATWAINNSSGASGLTVKNCTLIGAGNGSTVVNYAIQPNGPNFMCDGCNFKQFGQPINFGKAVNATVQNCYIANLNSSYPQTVHYEDIYVGGADGLVIQNNTLINEHGWTACVFMKNNVAAITNVTIQNNLMEGGGFCTYCDPSGTNGGATSNVKFLNNALTKGQYGYLYNFPGVVTNPPSGVTWTGNYDYGTGKPV